MKHKSLLLLALPLLFNSCTKVDVPTFSVVENEKDDTNSDQPLTDEMVKEAYDSKAENNEVEISDEDRIQEEIATKISERQSQNKILKTNRIVNLVRTSGTQGESFYNYAFIKSSISASDYQITAINDAAKSSFTINNDSIKTTYNKIGEGLIGKFEVSLKSDPTIKEELTLEAYTLAKIENFVEYKVDEENNVASIISVLDKDIFTLYLYQYYEKDGVSYPVTRIEDYAFANCTLLTNIWYLKNDGSYQGNNLPSNLEYIGKYAFYNCQSIASLKMGASSITPFAILDKTFYNCSSLSKFTVSQNVLTSIGKYAFYNCKSLSTIDNNGSVDAGASIEFVDDFAFANSAFTTGSSPVLATKRIGYAAFMNCPLYADIVFNDSLEEIDDFAFANASKISSIKIGTKLKTISSTSFFGINNYTVTVDSNNPYITCITGKTTIMSKDGKIMYSSVGIPIFSKDGTTFADKCIEVKPFAMYGRVCSYGSWSYSFSLVEIIGDYAFANTTNSSFPIEWQTSKLKSAGKGVFKNAKLTTVNLKSTSLTYISESMFENCKNLTSITLPANVTKIGKNAFKNCTSLTTINGLENVTEIEEGAFRGCSKLTAVNLNSIKHIGNFAFKGCSKAVIKFKTGVDTTKFDEFWNIDNLNYQEIA